MGTYHIQDIERFVFFLNSNNLLNSDSSLQFKVASTLHFLYLLIFTITCHVGTLIPIPHVKSET